MPLLAIWTSAPEAVAQMKIEQVVTSAGDGVLKDSSVCSTELREYLAQIPSSKIAEYIEQCLNASFVKSGMVLQDLVNELGRRLEYEAENGRYQGTSNAIGHDGLWLSPEGHSIILEVKTTDAYRISLDKISAYRTKLTAAGKLPGSSSVLIVVGREDTGELEAQVRGSRHAWDIRLISADALIKLVQLKENTAGTETGLKIRSLLIPMEYTRLDGMIDVMFATAKDVEGADAENTIAEEAASLQVNPLQEKRVWQFTDSILLQEKREQIISAMTKHTGNIYIKKSRIFFWDSGHTNRLVCTMSKKYTLTGSYSYWFAFHPAWQTLLEEGAGGYLVLGCMDLPCAFAVPLQIMMSLLNFLNTTTKPDGETYWHVFIAEPEPGQYVIRLPKKAEVLPLNSYRIDLIQ